MKEKTDKQRETDIEKMERMRSTREREETEERDTSMCTCNQFKKQPRSFKTLVNIGRSINTGTIFDHQIIFK